LVVVLALGLVCGQAVAAGSLPTPTPAPKQDFGGKRTDFAFAGGQAFVISPTSPAEDGSKPWIWYSPTISRHPGAYLSWLMQRLLAKGLYVAGLNVGEAMGNPASREQYAEFYQHVTQTYGLDAKVCLLAQSRGGLFHYNFAADHPEWIACIAGVYPVADLRSYPGLKKAALAYGLSEEALTTQLAKFNPIDRLAPLAKADIPILHLHGDADKTVPLELNSRVIYDRYRTLGGRMKLIVVPGKGHEEIPDYFESEALLQFILSKGQNLPSADGVIP
jgi:fermentation-respiration switch protein FrsA (DUF1100 family)